jgi:uncharacterized protein (DUF697 family)
MTTCKDEALRWVHRYALAGAAFAALPLPISTSAGLAAMETHMTAMIGEIYGENLGAVTTTAAGGSFSIMGQGLKFLASRAVGLIPIIGPAIKMTIAGVTIEALGHAIVGHFERKYPSRNFRKT